MPYLLKHERSQWSLRQRQPLLETQVVVSGRVQLLRHTWRVAFQLHMMSESQGAWDV